MGQLLLPQAWEIYEIVKVAYITTYCIVSSPVLDSEDLPSSSESASETEEDYNPRPF